MNEQIQGKQKNETMGENSFMKKLIKKRLNQKGLTLIELLAVIVILAIIAAIAVPAIGNIINNSRVGAIKADAINAVNASALYFTDNANATPAVDTVTVAVLVEKNYMESKGTLDDTGTIIYKNSGGNKIHGNGTTGGITVNFGTVGAASKAVATTVEKINAKPNSDRDTAGGNVQTIAP